MKGVRQGPVATPGTVLSSVQGRIELLGTVVLVVILAAGTLFLRSDGVLHAEWYEQSTVLFVILASLSVGLTLVTNRRAKAVLLAFILVVAAVIAVPFRGVASYRIMLLFYVTFAGFATRNFVATVLAPAAYVASLRLFRDAPLAWSLSPATLTNTDLLFTAAIGAMCALLLAWLQLGLRDNHALKKEVAQLRETTEELTAANLGYSEFMQLARRQSAVEERNRITRDIHDGVGYTLTNIIMLSEVAIDVCPHDAPLLKENLDAIRMQAKTGLFDTRRSLRELRCTDSGEPRGAAALGALVDTYSRSTRVAAKTEVLTPPTVLEDSTIFITTYRFVQEALTNTFRHGHASRVVVRVQRDTGWLIVSVVDNGIGDAEVEEGIGLQGMRERIEELGGELHYNGIGGFSVIARLPVQENKL